MPTLTAGAGQFSAPIEVSARALLVVIDGGVAEYRSDDEMRHWIEAFKPQVGADPAGLHLGLRAL